MADISYKTMNLNQSNLDEHLSGPACFLNPQHPAALEKAIWFKERFKEGMRTKLVLVESEKKPISFIEYADGENAWRAVDAKDYLFIHSLSMDNSQ